MSRSRHWCFTLNNYTQDDFDRFLTTPEGLTYCCVGKEVGESGTPHLQGFLSYRHPQRLSSLRSSWFTGRAHWESARYPYQAAEYCKKEGDFVEHGNPPCQPAAESRNHLSSFKDSVKGGQLSHKRLREDFSEVYAKYPRFCFDYVRDQTPRPSVEPHPLRPWQQELYKQLVLPADKRRVIFCVDLRGNTGKSWFCDYYENLHSDDTQVLNPGKKADMAMTLDPNIRVLFIDAPRSKQGEFIQYDFLEDVKNGRVFSGKYESGMKYLKNCHVVVMMNEMPDMRKLSPDRYNIITLN